MDEARTEAATPRKHARARARGVVACSPDLTAAAGILALMAVLAFRGRSLLQAYEQALLEALRAAAQPAPQLSPALHASLMQVLGQTAGVLLAIASGAALVAFVQVGPVFATSAIAADLRRLDPVARLAAAFSKERLLELGWTAVKLALLLGIAVWAVGQSARAVLALEFAASEDGLRILGVAVAHLITRVALAAAALGAADLIYRRLRHARQLRMTRRELIEEHRESYGLPAHRAQRQRAYREASAQAALAAVRGAQLLLLDGNRRALALAFDQSDERQHAPRIVAKSGGELTARIRLAAEHDLIPVRWDPQLVGALFGLELSEEIPRAHYERVADLFRGLPLSRGTSAP